MSRLADVESEPGVDSRVQQPARSVLLPFPTRTVPTRRSETNEDLLKLFRKVEINIPLLDAIKQVPKYAKFLKELCIHKRKKMKGGVEIEGIVLALAKHEDATVGNYQDPGIFSVPCTIGNYTFIDVMLDLGASINVMPALVYRSLNFGDLEPTRMVIQLANRSIVQPLGILEDVLVQVNELIFPTDFYVLDMEDEASGKGSALILGQPFFMTARTKIDVHARTLSMEFEDNLTDFNRQEEVETDSVNLEEAKTNLVNLEEAETDSSRYQQARFDSSQQEFKQVEAESNFKQPGPHLDRVGQLISSTTKQFVPPQSPLTKLKPLPEHLKYAYLDDHQQFPIIIANNLGDRLSKDQPFHLHAQDFIRGGSPTYKAAAAKTKSNHSGHYEERSHKTTCSQDHLSHLGQPMGEPSSSSAKEVQDDCREEW
ncbi:hypothetical protein CR513_24553, partial [Mucuna pruriens]